MGSRILVIEDNPINMELMTYLLRACGYDPVSAFDGETGIALARAEVPDLIVCDIQMPGIDGYEVAHRIKADPALARVPLLAVTAYAMAGDVRKALAAGFDVHFSKPIDPAAFMASLSKLLPGATGPAPPTATQTAPVPAPMPPELRAPREGITLLLADDTPDNVHFKLRLLEPAGYQVRFAFDGADALAQLRRQRVDLVISDVVMRGVSGFDLLVRIRADPQLRDLPFMFLTSTARDPDSQARAMALGANRYLMRPIAPQDLLREIRACLGGP